MSSLSDRTMKVKMVITLALVAMMVEASAHATAEGARKPGNTVKQKTAVTAKVQGYRVAALPSATLVASGDRTTASLSPEQVLAQVEDAFSQGNAVRAQFAEHPYPADPALRKQIVLPMLESLKMLVDYDVPESPSLVPQPKMVPVWSHIGPERADMLDEHHEQLAEADEARRKWMAMMDLAGWRRVLTTNTVGFYTYKPYNTEELRTLAQSVLKDDSLVSALCSEVDSKNNARERLIEEQLRTKP